MADPGRSDRDILIDVETTLENFKEEVIGGPGRKGRLPMLEDKQDEHASRLDQAEGARRLMIWLIAGFGGAILTFGAVLLAHLLGGK